MILKAKALLAGLATWIPGYDYNRTTGGTNSARYCYSVWLRHLILAQESGRLPAGVPRVVAELGPGDSIGIGVAALLSGAEKYFALDLVPYSDLRRTRELFDELVQLFEERHPVPGGGEFPALKPALESDEFPRHILDDATLRAALDLARVAQIRAAIEHAADAPTMIVYQAPWNDPAVIQPGSVDFIFSQAVLEHIDDLDGVYAAMRRWLRPAGLMSHQIDFQCHRKADTWNGHWTYSDFAWKVVVGRRAYLLNRAPHSRHLAMLAKNGFEVVIDRPVRTTSVLKRRQLAARFRELSDEDLTTSGAYLVAAPAAEKRASAP
ncbi:MAG: methyltransferase domain-containing protein [Steroidobacteraceae bacterium]